MRSVFSTFRSHSVILKIILGFFFQKKIAALVSSWTLGKDTAGLSAAATVFKSEGKMVCCTGSQTEKCFARSLVILFYFIF